MEHCKKLEMREKGRNKKTVWTISNRRERVYREWKKRSIFQVVEELVQQEKVTWIRAAYDRSYLTDASLVVAATDHTQVNHQVKADCLELEKEQNRQIFVSVADDKSLCDFYFPSIVQDEEMVIGINSGGASPHRTKEVRQEIEKLLEKKSIYQ